MKEGLASEPRLPWDEEAVLEEEGTTEPAMEEKGVNGEVEEGVVDEPTAAMSHR